LRPQLDQAVEAVIEGATARDGIRVETEVGVLLVDRADDRHQGQPPA